MHEEAQKYYQEGKKKVETGDIDTASIYFHKTIALQPGFVPAYNEIAIIYTIKGQVEEAKEMYLKAITVAPQEPYAYSNLALLYEEEGDLPNALACWKKRAVLGGPEDVWSSIARKRIAAISQSYPGIYQKVQEGQYTTALPQPFRQPNAAGEYSGADQGVSFTRPEAVTLFNDERTKARKGSLESQVTAVDYLGRAREYYARGEYVRALKEATIAEYLDPTNREVSSFVQQIRDAILQ